MSTRELVERLRDAMQVLREQNAVLGQLVEGLREQNAALKQENTELKHLIAGLKERDGQLQQELGAAEERIGELEQAKGGGASFKANRAKRERAGTPRRKRAKEQDHGRSRSAVITKCEEHPIERCPTCASKLRKGRVAWRREVLDLPPPQAVTVTEHVVFKGYCPRCGAWRYAEPCGAGEAVGQRRFGVRLMALIGYLSESLRLPEREIQRYLETLHGLHLSLGAIVDLRHGLATRLQPVAEQLQAQVRSSAIVHADETGWREDGQNGYVWVFSTPGEQGVRCYHFERSRGQQVVEALLGTEFHGVLVSDFYGGYNVYRGQHQRCWVHLLRDLHTLKEEHPQDDIQACSGGARGL